MFQRTLSAPVEFSGVGIHSGAVGRIRVSAAPANSGITFTVGEVAIPAVAEHVLSTRRCTLLGRDGVSVSTVEHLLAALYGLGIDNARIEVEGPEIPILDGSAGPFVARFLEAGLQEQAAPARCARLIAPLWLAPEGAGPETTSILALPGDGLTVTAAIDFGRPGASRQVFSFRVGDGASLAFARELAPARTFCFEDEVAAILAAGLGGGGSRENTVIVSADGPATPLRFSDELARHKALDLLGDLALIGARLTGHVIALRAGHTLHVALASEIRKALRRSPAPDPEKATHED